jgi:hypothetical protein
LSAVRVIALRFGVASHLVEHGALGGEDAPVGLVGRMSAAEHVQGLIEIAGLRQRTAVSAEHGRVARIGKRHPLEDGDRLCALPGRAQRLRVVQRRVDVAGTGAILLSVDSKVVPPVGVGAVSRRDR